LFDDPTNEENDEVQRKNRADYKVSEAHMSPWIPPAFTHSAIEHVERGLFGTLKPFLLLSRQFLAFEFAHILIYG
jgi:hypothetical protein